MLCQQCGGRNLDLMTIKLPAMWTSSGRIEGTKICKPRSQKMYRQDLLWTRNKKGDPIKILGSYLDGVRR